MDEIRLNMIVNSNYIYSIDLLLMTALLHTVLLFIYSSLESAGPSVDRHSPIDVMDPTIFELVFGSLEVS